MHHLFPSFRHVIGPVMALVIGGCAACAPAAPGDENWPALRGPLASGVAPQAVPPLT